MLAFDAITFISLFFIPAYYGRFYKQNTTLYCVPNTVGWIVQEIPNIIVTIYYTYFHIISGKIDMFRIFLISLFLIHYVHRTLIFPFKLVNSKKMPIEIVTLAFGFTLFNSIMINRSIYMFADYTDVSNIRVLLGFTLFIIGMYINILHDYHVLRLKNNSEGYIIPDGYLFRYISSPNYLGEMVEWIGFAIASNTIAGAIFAISTFSNLFPRALEYRKWYINKFGDVYPKDRKAIIPFII